MYDFILAVLVGSFPERTFDEGLINTITDL